MKPMFALHKDKGGPILTAGTFAYDFELGNFVRGLDLRAGDVIEFGEAVKREAEEAEVLPAFLSDPAPAPPAAPETNAALVDEQPF